MSRGVGGVPSHEVAGGLNSSDIRTNANIPFADEVVELEYVRPRSILQKDAQPLVAPRRTRAPAISVTDSAEPGSSAAACSRLLAEERSDAEEEEMMRAQRADGLRRNSISMPTLQNLELEVLRQQYLSNPQQEMAERRRKKPDLRVMIPKDINHRGPLSPTSPTGLLILPPNRSIQSDLPYMDEDEGISVRTDDDSRVGSPIYFRKQLDSTRNHDNNIAATDIKTPRDSNSDDGSNQRVDSRSDTLSNKSSREGAMTDAMTRVEDERSMKDNVSTTETVGTTVSEIMREADATGEGRGVMKRNSISMPNRLQDYELEMLRKMYLQRIPEHHQSDASGFGDADGDVTPAGGGASDDEREKSPLRSPRRGLRRARTGRSELAMELGAEDDYSPSHSITSINSLASLLREKLQSIPTKIRKKPADYKLRAFVGLLFLAIVFFVGFAYVMYHQQALAKAYFQSIKFNKAKRVLMVYNKYDQEILKGNLAIGMAASSAAYPCLPEDRRPDGSVCLEWLSGLRFYLNYSPHEPGPDSTGNTTCYSIEWQTLRPGVLATDCFDWKEIKQHWYGGGQSANFTWPLEIGSHDFTPFVTGDTKREQWGNVLTRYFINSKGAAIIVDDNTPLYISINKDNDKQLCLQARHDDFAFVNHQTEFPELRYNICASHNMKALHSSIHSHQITPLWDGLKPEDMATLDSLISEPVWQIAPRFKHELTESTIYNYTDDVLELGFLKQGHVLINELWQNEIGDFTLDTSRFETLDQTVDVLHRRGFKIVFAIQPFISTESRNFAECVQKRLLVSERSSDIRIPALTRYKSLPSAGLLDITNNRTIPWLHEKLRAITDKYKIDSFYLDVGTAQDMPHYYRCEKPLVNPDHYKTVFTKSFERTLSVVGVSAAVSLPRPPVFVSLPPMESSWEALRLVIPTMLTYGIIGYPFLMPGAVGGDIYWPGSEQYIPTPGRAPTNSSSAQENGIALPERELYMRWLQLATFLPVMKFTHLPSKYNDERVLELAKNLTAVRQKTVTPLLLKYKREALEEGLPLIRPLWLVAPGDPAALTVDDEFSVGDEIIVAPVLRQGATTREVYLPAGVWKDGIDQSLRKGSRWMHEYKVPQEKVAFFVKMPDNTRF